MAEKLNWVYNDQSTEQHAFVGTDIRIRAVRDDDASNPFDGDGHWPLSVRSPDGHSSRSTFTDYGDDAVASVRNPLGRIGDAELIHTQVNIAQAFGFDTVGAMLGIIDLEHILVKYSRDPGLLREAAEQALADVEDSRVLETCAEIYTVLGVPVLCGQTNGYSQGDWAEVLVIAPPELVEKFGCITPITTEVLRGTIDLYGAWAWGDCYGYIIERVHLDDDGDVDDELTEELESCWGYYGSDHGDSGLEESALAACPKEDHRALLEA